MSLLSTLKHPAVRALAWSCFSPPLLRRLALANGDEARPPPLELTPERRHWLRSLDNDPSALLQHLNSRCTSPRLGLVFESLWHFFLREDPATELIDHNLPIRHNGRTLGEFDILYFCHQRQQYHHLELAVKFYLATPAPAVADDPLSYWLGPNCQDRLDIKLQHLRHRQLLLGQTDVGREALSTQGIAEARPELLINGYLFGRWRSALPDTPLLAADSQRGSWIPHSQFATELHDYCPQWLALDKPNWLGGLPAARAIDSAFHEKSRQRPQMLIGTDGSGSERLRVFITPDDWPEPRRGPG